METKQEYERRHDAISSAYERRSDEISWMILDAAYDRFEKCGAASDFCVQSIRHVSVVFGGVNRVVFCPYLDQVWRPEKSHCTHRFLQAWEENYGGQL